MKLTVKNLRKLIKEEMVNTASPNPWADQRYIVDAIADAIEEEGNPEMSGDELMDHGYDQGYNLETMEELDADESGLQTVVNAVIGDNDYSFSDSELYQAVKNNLDAVLEILRDNEDEDEDY